MLVSCVAYENGVKVADIPVTEISDWVHRPNCLVWVALFEPTLEELDEMAQEFGLHELAVEDARKGHQRPKIEEYGDVLFVVLHMIETGETELRVGEVDVFVGRNFILSVRTGVEKGFRDVRARAEREPELLRHGAGFVLYVLMDAVVDRYFPVLDAIEAQLEKIEDRLFVSSSPRENIEALYYVKQRLGTLKHAVAPLLENVGKLYGGRVPMVCTGLGEYFRDVYDHLIRINQSIDAARETVNTAIQVALAVVNMGHGEITKRLAAYAALVAVPTMIAGVYGMNFKHMPELDWSLGYPVSIALMAGIDAFLFTRFRKAGWL